MMFPGVHILNPQETTLAKRVNKWFCIMCCETNTYVIIEK